MRLTLQQAREALFDAVVPNLDSQENIDKFTQYINFAQERLINGGKWQGTLQPVRFLQDVQAQTFTLPRRLVSVLAVKFEKSGWVWPGRIQNIWYSYLPYTQNLQDRSQWGCWGFGQSNFDDLGDGYPTTYDSPYTNYKVRVVITNSADVGKKLTYKANGINGQPLYSTIDGEVSEAIRLTCASPSTTGVEILSGQIQFVTKELTSGYLLLDVLEVVDGLETGLSYRVGFYEPGETSISLRRYQAYSGWDSVGIQAIAKIRYVAARTDEDEIFPANLGALRNALAGILYEKNSDPGRRDEAFATAYTLLNQELKESMGGAVFRLQIDPQAFQLGSIGVGI